jgi:hypothetical protein
VLSEGARDAGQHYGPATLNLGPGDEVPWPGTITKPVFVRCLSPVDGLARW